MKALPAQLFLLLQEIYKADTGRLHDNVSNLVDALLDYHGSALLQRGGHVRKLHVSAEIFECCGVLHRAMGLSTTPLVGLHVDAIPYYAIGFLLLHFLPAALQPAQNLGTQ